ncbi:MAG: rod shape-determining protein RodA [Thermodesulfovibrionales bacterium]|nr:rod shape-determining protein RodA [Thermodesulfovibrionales bacterium]
MSRLVDRLDHFDWLIFGIAVSLSLLGILTIYSATRMPDYDGVLISEGFRADFFQRQIIWLFAGITFFFGVLFIDYQWFKRTAYLLYGISIFLLILALVAGKKTMGASRWINLGFFSFQPTDLFKVSFLIALSSYLHDIKTRLTARVIFKIFFLFVLLPVLLIFKQPDLGSAAIIFIAFLCIILIYGAESRFLKLAMIIGLISLPFLWPVFWENLKDYQRNRIQAFLSEEVDPAGIGYHIKQSKIAIGSGGLFGKGYLKGTQGPLRFLPERHTDFIFAAFAEEWGFIGAVIVLSLYILYIFRGFDTAKRARDNFGRYLATGISVLMGLYVFINIGMALGLTPVVGIPLPFMSYGGSALVTNFIMAGILVNIRMRRFEIFY